jgi:YidC/Oxa1 family membrane protein insertase
MIIQLPVFIGLYNTLNLFLLNGQAEKTIDSINKVLYFSALKIETINSWFFGLDLVKTPKQAGTWVYFLIPVITALLQYFQAQASMPSSAKATEGKPPTTGNKIAEVDKKSDGGGDFQKAMNTQMKYMFPLMIGWFSYTLPVGLALYWNIFSIMGIMQYKKVNGN